MYNLSNLTLGKLILGLLLIAWEIFLHTISIITPFFRGNLKSINGFKLWRKGKLQYAEIISGLQDNQFFVDINYGYTSLILSNNRLKIKPYPKRGVSLSNEILKNDKLFYVLYNNHLQVIDEDLNESGCFYSEEIVEGIFLVDKELYIITASRLFGYFNIFVAEVGSKNVSNVLDKKLIKELPYQSITVINGGFVSKNIVYNHIGESVIDLNFIADSYKFDSFRNIEITSVNSKFALLVFYNAEKNWSIKTITLTDTQLLQVHDLPINDSWTINSITLKIAPNEKYFVYKAEKEDGNHEIWLGEIYEENGYFKTKVKSLAVFENINEIEFSRDGNILALKVNYKDRDWFAFKDISSLHD